MWCSGLTTVQHAVEVAGASSGAREDLGAAIALRVWFAEAGVVAGHAVGASSARTTTAIVTALFVLAVGDAATLSATNVFHQHRTFVGPDIGTAGGVHRTDALGDVRVFAAGAVVALAALSGALPTILRAGEATLAEVGLAKAVAAARLDAAICPAIFFGFIGADVVPLYVAAVDVHCTDTILHFRLLASDGAVGRATVALAGATIPGATDAVLLVGVTLAVAA